MPEIFIKIQRAITVMLNTREAEKITSCYISEIAQAVE